MSRYIRKKKKLKILFNIQKEYIYFNMRLCLESLVRRETISLEVFDGSHFVVGGARSDRVR